MTTAITPNGATIFTGISSDPANKLNAFLDTDGNYKWTIADGTVVLTVNTTTGLITPQIGAGVTTLAGTTNQITASAATGAVTLSLSSTLVAPGAVTVTTRTGTPSTFATFDSGGKLVAGASYSAPVGPLAGTANQITASAASGSVTLSLPSAVTMPGSLAVTTVTGTPATFACFDSGNKLVSSAVACA